MDIQVARFGRMFQKLFNLKQSLTLGQALPDVMSVVTLTDLPEEMDIFAGVNRCIGYGVAVGAAGQQSEITLTNPASSGSVLVVEAASVWCAVAQDVRLGFDTATTGTYTGSHQNFLDMRRHGNVPTSFNSPVGRVLERTAGTATGYNISMNVRAAAGITLDLTNLVRGAVVPPGASLLLQSGTVALEIVVNWKWRERQVNADELSAG